MTDLEDRFLKQNVPGRYSSWAGEGDDDDDPGCRQDGDDDGRGGANDGDDDSDDDDERYFEGLPPLPGPPPPPSIPGRNKTGVKGVLADYEAAREEDLRRIDEARLDREAALRRATRPAVRVRPELEQVGTADGDDDDGEGNGREENDDDGDDEEGEILKSLRRRRLAELRSRREILASAPRYGDPPSLVSPSEYVALVDALDPRSYLVVHLSDRSNSRSRALRESLERVAPLLDRAKFVEVDAREANPELDSICLPAVLVYKAGKLAKNWVRFTDDLRGRGGAAEEVRIALEGAMADV
ncbi:hypothetical protein ACHAWF_013978 [Thalassiosira exigua]